MDEVLEAFGKLVCQAHKLPPGDYLAEEMNHAVSKYPTPMQALQLLKKPVGELKLLYVDAGLDYMCDWFMGMFMGGVGILPVCLMPVERVTQWKDAHEFRTLKAMLSPHGLSAYMTFDSEIFVRGRLVCPCDMRPSFLKGYRRA